MLQALQAAGGGMSGAPDPRMLAEMDPRMMMQKASLNPSAGPNEPPEMGPNYREPARGEMGENNKQMMRDTMNEGISDEEELAKMHDGMGQWEGEDKPTPDDIAKVKTDPKLEESFIERFGEEALPSEAEPDSDSDD